MWYVSEKFNFRENINFSMMVSLSICRCDGNVDIARAKRLHTVCGTNYVYLIAYDVFNHLSLSDMRIIYKFPPSTFSDVWTLNKQWNIGECERMSLMGLITKSKFIPFCCSSCSLCVFCGHCPHRYRTLRFLFRRFNCFSQQSVSQSLSQSDNSIIWFINRFIIMDYVQLEAATAVLIPSF